MSVIGVVLGAAIAFAGVVAWQEMRRQTVSLKPAIVSALVVLGGGLLILEGVGLI